VGDGFVGVNGVQRLLASVAFDGANSAIFLHRMPKISNLTKLDFASFVFLIRHTLIIQRLEFCLSRGTFCANLKMTKFVVVYCSLINHKKEVSTVGEYPQCPKCGREMVKMDDGQWLCKICDHSPSLDASGSRLGRAHPSGVQPGSFKEVMDRGVDSSAVRFKDDAPVYHEPSYGRIIGPLVGVAAIVALIALIVVNFTVVRTSVDVASQEIIQQMDEKAAKEAESKSDTNSTPSPSSTDDTSQLQYDPDEVSFKLRPNPRASRKTLILYCGSDGTVTTTVRNIEDYDVRWQSVKAGVYWSWIDSNTIRVWSTLTEKDDDSGKAMVAKLYDKNNTLLGTEWIYISIRYPISVTLSTSFFDEKTLTAQEHQTLYTTVAPTVEWKEKVVFSYGDSPPRGMSFKWYRDGKLVSTESHYEARFIRGAPWTHKLKVVVWYHGYDATSFMTVKQ